MDQELWTELLAGSQRTMLHMRTLRVLSPDGSTFLSEMTSLPLS